MDDQSSEPFAAAGRVRRAFFLTNAESDENAPSVQTEGENSDAKELEESKEELLASNDDQQEEESITNDTAFAHEDVDPEADANDISSTTADAKDQQLPEQSADSPAKETGNVPTKNPAKKKEETKIAKAAKPKLRQFGRFAQSLPSQSVATKSQQNDDKATIKKKPEARKASGGQRFKTEARHVCRSRRPGKDQSRVVIPPVSIRWCKSWPNYSRLFSRDYQLEARLCYKRGLAESGCSALLRRWALEAEEQRQRQQQQQQPAASPEASRRQIVRRRLAVIDYQNLLQLAASPRRESSSRPADNLGNRIKGCRHSSSRFCTSAVRSLLMAGWAPTDKLLGAQSLLMTPNARHCGVATANQKTRASSFGSTDGRIVHLGHPGVFHLRWIRRGGTSRINRACVLEPRKKAGAPETASDDNWQPEHCQPTTASRQLPVDNCQPTTASRKTAAEKTGQPENCSRQLPVDNCQPTTASRENCQPSNCQPSTASRQIASRQLPVEKSCQPTNCAAENFPAAVFAAELSAGSFPGLAVVGWQSCPAWQCSGCQLSAGSFRLAVVAGSCRLTVVGWQLSLAIVGWQCSGCQLSAGSVPAASLSLAVFQLQLSGWQVFSMAMANCRLAVVAGVSRWQFFRLGSFLGMAMSTGSCRLAIVGDGSFLAGNCRLAVAAGSCRAGCRLAVCRLAVVGWQLSTGQLSAAVFRWQVVGWQFSRLAIVGWQTAGSSCRLAVVDWQLSAGSCRLAVVGWQLVVDWQLSGFFPAGSCRLAVFRLAVVAGSFPAGSCRLAVSAFSGRQLGWTRIQH
uniref:HECT-type E3 ubiquitin transferase n=1 Tax=Macrostomum lignano TaxID=282301 RepID=A0A1I8FB41_9PLAT